MVNIISIKSALRPSRIKTRNLDITSIDPTSITAGNNAVSVRCRISGRKGYWLLKCYFRHKPHLEQIYCKAYYPNELCVRSIGGSEEYIDVVALPWVEGKSLDWYIGRHDTDYAALSRAFDIMALTILDASFAHGDIKPDNIIVGPHNVMTLIDHDAEWRPELGLKEATEIGTLAYRHPQRDAEYFNKHIDDYPIALISTALAALALDKECMEQYIKADKTLFTAELCVRKQDRALEQAKKIFIKHRDVAHYRIANGLHTCTPSIFSLRNYIYYAVNPFKLEIPEWSTPYRSEGYWGYLKNDIWVIPPLFEYCLELTKGIGTVTLGETTLDLPVVSAPRPHKKSLSWMDLIPTFNNRPQPKPNPRASKYVKNPSDDRCDNHGKLWCSEEEELMAIYLFDGCRLPFIARQLGRTEKAIVARIHKLKLPITKRNRRKKP